MICIVELAMTIFGIVTLARGKFSLTRNKVITGPYAYAIGIILTLTLPVLMGMGFLLGFVIAMNAHGRQIRPEEFLKYAWLDMVAVPVILAFVGFLAAIAPKSVGGRASMTQQGDDQAPQDIPPMGDNPYASPYTIDPDTRRPQA
jgi:hypothetical protein